MIQSILRSKKLALMLFALGWLFESSYSVIDPPVTRCKYSVRDVAFVNAHGRPWQLELIKPKDVDSEKFAKWNRELKSRLSRSNLGYVWYDSDTADAQRLINQISATELKAIESPEIFLSHNGVESFKVEFDSSISFEQNIERIVSSPARTSVLENVVDSLCVFVLIESRNEEANQAAIKTIEAAIKQVNTQMWTLEKPTDHGPALVSVDAQDQTENLLIKTLGWNGDIANPAVAVVYGQGRRLGGLLSGNEITLDKLVARASICGQDCECDLSRDWLYATQVIHVWSTANERLAEESLDFDPQSAFVIAEVAQILRKTGNKPFDEDKVRMGSGLIVHDFDPENDLEQNSQVESTPPRVNEEVTSNIAKRRPKSADGNPTSQDKSQYQSDSLRNSSIPWILIVGLFVISMIVFVIKSKVKTNR